MQKYTFAIVCTDDTVGDSPDHKKIKLVGNVSGEEKTITFCGPCIGAYGIFERNRKNFFQLWVESAKYKFREGGFCDSWTNGKLDYKQNIQLKHVKLKVILDEDCEYKIAVSVEDDQWITLPKSSLSGENLNLKRYYGQKLSLSRGEKFKQHGDADYYIPKVMCGQTEVCDLVPYSFPSCELRKARFEGPSNFILRAEGDRIVVEKNDEGELSIYLAKENGDRYHNIYTNTKNVIDYLNSVLKAVLLENSNIREVLPELNIDDDVDIDKRQLKCLVHNIVPKEVAQELVTNKKDELGKAVLDVKNGDEEILVNSPILQERIVEKLRENPGNAKGPKGEDGATGSQGERGLQGPQGEKVLKEKEVYKVLRDQKAKMVLRALGGQKVKMVLQVSRVTKAIKVSQMRLEKVHQPLL
ncbi:collagen-like triple helix repeat-containing protein [Wolbachia pipientis]|uniref:collagen-like triple helix repeat-containing protein n=1 Tax=Wolbachia pipientis TaxID=955 RepID=UPI0020307509|nr:collagen-like protein [Wolbachia pipientis]MCM1002497.1 hypothetical protein [Wolbachia pipientis]